MRKFNLLFFVLILATMSCVSNKKFTSLQEEKDALAQTLAEVEGKVKMLEEKNMDLSKSKDQLDTNIKQVKSELDNTKSQIVSLEKNVEAKEEKLNEMQSDIKEVFSEIEKSAASADMRIKELEDMLYLDFEEKIGFRTASASVSAGNKELLEKLATVLKENPSMHFIVEGHADKRTISNERYKDNWELSVDRSLAVVRKLVKMGVDPSQLTAAGRGANMPAVTDNPDSKETLKANRRTEIIVVPNLGKLYQMHKSN